MNKLFSVIFLFSTLTISIFPQQYLQEITQKNDILEEEILTHLNEIDSILAELDTILKGQKKVETDKSPEKSNARDFLDHEKNK